ncbi:MAG: citrate lyase holo-[Prevotella sp.]|nr:citrate lyase holo-[acyl-carrier protein] synthase [Prevotella sp.]
MSENGILKGVGLQDLLASRDHRWHRQMELLREHPNETLLCLTVIMPGSVKRNRLSLAVARAATEAIRVEFGDSITQMEERDLETGFEAYVLVSLPTLEAKQTACRIEENHPLGRLFDIDVINPTGSPVSRSAVGAQPRRCLLCDNEARFCMRNHTHSPEQIQAHIAEIVEAYVHDGI